MINRKLSVKHNEVFVLSEGVWLVNSGIVQKTKLTEDQEYINVNLYSERDYIYVDSLDDCVRFKAISNAEVSRIPLDVIDTHVLLTQLSYTEKLVYVLGNKALPVNKNEKYSEEELDTYISKGRVMLFLDWLSEKLDRRDAVTLFSQEQIAQFCSITRCTVNKYLKRLSAGGYVSRYRYERGKENRQ